MTRTDYRAAWHFANTLRKKPSCSTSAACADALRPTAGKVAIAGFCTGGTWAWVSASSLELDAAVIFYGTDIPDYLDRHAKCPAIMHYGDLDHILPIETVRQIEANYPEVEFQIYPGAGHAFYNPEQANHNANAAETAYGRSIAFLDKQFGA